MDIRDKLIAPAFRIAPAVLAGGGEMGALVRAHDWAATPLGSLANWPAGQLAAVSLMLNSPESMYLLWGPELIFFFNDAYRPVLGSRLDGALGQPVADLWGEAWEQVRPMAEKALAGEPSRFEDLPVAMVREGRSEQTWWSFSYSPVFDETGTAAGVLCITNETTERVRSTALIRASEEQQRRLLRQMPGFAAVTVGPDHVYDYVNDAFVALSGRADAIGRSVRDLFPELADQGYLELLDRIYATGEPFSAAALPVSLKDKPGSLFVNVHYQPLRDERGAITGVFVSGHDATAHVNAERELRSLNADLERQVVERSLERGRTWDVSPDLLSVIDMTNGVFLHVNPAWQAKLGFAPDMMVGRAFADLVHPDDLPASRAAFEQVRSGEPVLHFENRYRHRDGTFLTLSWVAIPSAGKLYSTARDVTAEHEQRAALLQAEDQLRQAQKMEAVGQLTGGLAHDFNNLLAGISGALDLMQARIKQGRLADVERYVTAAQGAARRAASLTHRLLAFSRRQTLAPKPTDVNKLVGSIEDMIQRTVGPAITVETLGAPDLWTALVDPPQLENALLNLCINARDAMQGGGRITIATANAAIDESTARGYETTAGEYLSLGVSDTGSGMTPEVIARVFEPFFTTKPLGEGTGLGLSMIYGFAKQSGGLVSIDSEVGVGTSVRIYLPRHHGTLEAGGPAPGPAEATRAEQGETVLVVDDEPTIRMLLTDVLEDLGYTAIEANDGAAGLAVLQSDARIDLLVTDVGLPGGMNGRQMVDAARAARRDLKVLFITGYAEGAALEGGCTAPGTEVMTKPFALDDLAARIKALIAG